MERHITIVWEPKWGVRSATVLDSGNRTIVAQIEDRKPDRTLGPSDGECRVGVTSGSLLARLELHPGKGGVQWPPWQTSDAVLLELNLMKSIHAGDVRVEGDCWSNCRILADPTGMNFRIDFLPLDRLSRVVACGDSLLFGLRADGRLATAWLLNAIDVTDDPMKAKAVEWVILGIPKPWEKRDTEYIS